MMNRFFEKFIFVILPVMFVFSACGYSTRSSLPASIRNVCVQPFVNNIDFQSGRSNLYFPLMEVKAHDAVVKEFVFDGNLKISKEDDADLILKAELNSYDRSATRLTNTNDVQEYRIQITTHLTMTNREGKILWEEPSFAGTASYYLSGPKATSEAAAVEEAVKDLAKRIVERTVEDW